MGVRPPEPGADGRAYVYDSDDFVFPALTGDVIDGLRVAEFRQGDSRFTIFNVGGSYVWPRGHAAHIFSVRGYNLTNDLYRNHPSFIKDLAPEIGRGAI